MENLNWWPLSKECYTTYASSVDPLNKESWTLARHIHHFIETNSTAKQALANAEAAEQNHISIAKNLYKYLAVADFEPRFRIASDLAFSLHNIPKLLNTKIVENPNLVRLLRHPLVQVNHVLFDFSFRRLGDNYLNKPDTTEREIKQYFKILTENSKLIEITPDQARLMVADQTNRAKEARYGVN